VIPASAAEKRGIGGRIGGLEKHIRYFIIMLYMFFNGCRIMLA
jgi:hypothetical protein